MPNATMNNLVAVGAADRRHRRRRCLPGPQDPKSPDKLMKKGQIAFDFGAFFSKGLRMGTGQANVKRYNRQLRDLIHAGPREPVVHHLASSAPRRGAGCVSPLRRARRRLDEGGAEADGMKTSAAAVPCGGATGTGSAADFIPPRPTLPKLREAAAHCRGCDLWACGHVVFGEGPRSATVMFVGEQPGDQEEAEGHPFVGPAGKLLDAALEEAGIDRKSVYVTNAVKHFKFERGAKSKRRIHKKPNDTRDSCLSSLARGRDQSDEAARHRRARRHGCAVAARQAVSGHAAAREAGEVGAREHGDRNGASIVGAPRAGR